MIHREVPICEAIENKFRGPIQITLIMMTRNRQNHIKPLIDYYSDYPIHLIVADGSDSAFVPPPIPKGADAAFQISYVHDAHAQSYITRLSASLKLTMTPLVLLVPDDEIFLWGGIKESIRALTADKTIASAGGSSTLCRKFGKRLSYVNYLNYGFSPKDSWYNDSWRNLQIDPPIALVRVMQVIASPLLIRFHFYRVVRVEVIKKFLSIIFHNGTFIDLGLGEFIFAMSTHLCGKSYFHETPFWIRTQISDHGRATNIGQYGEKEVRTIAMWIKCELETNLKAPSDTHWDKILEEALTENIGPSSALRQVYINYARLGVIWHLKFKVKKIIENFAPLLSKFLTNRNLVDKFRFDKEVNFILGFTQNHADHHKNQEQFTKASKALSLIID